ncbi:hypothetical protein N7493_004275 [Penicillium malachiteum]|uniref:Uncharacterized protein n=1 Tax=Penicillium malachiteum TaxID=1324776 RepID=A0AAD6HRK4_9EURO|nr:hypothetical protein N7493_004275 [Penicillium malachiteum]
MPYSRRSELLTTNRTLLDTVFEHSEETFCMYCNYPSESKQCQKVFIDGVVDTIISLPPHVGEGPFARIISIELADPVLKLPIHHLKHCALEEIEENPVYRVKIDYNFHDIQPKGDNKEPVMIRVDLTNLLGYWEEMTTAPEDSLARVKRGIGNDSLTVDEWRTRVQRASRKEANLQKRQANVNISSSMDLTNSSASSPRKRWFGPFSDWLKRLTTVTKSSVGVLELGLAKTINLLRYTAGCELGHLFAEIKLDLQANMALDVKYAYYLSAIFVAPSKPETRIERKKIIDTLAYPGLAVNGIAAIGPTLDFYGEIRGSITLSGSLDAGASLKFGKAEVYWPERDDAKDKYETLLSLSSEATAPSGRNVEPVFKAGVAVDAALDVIITPEAHIGIKIGGGTLVGSATLIDAQLFGFVEADLNFRAHADLSSSDQAFHYSLGSYIIYNLGYSAKGRILGIVDWITSDRKAWNRSPELTLYEKSGTIPLLASAESDNDLVTLFEKITMSTEGVLDSFASEDIYLMGSISTNWKYLDPDPPANDDRGDFWLLWGGDPGRGAWTEAGQYGNQRQKYTQKFKEYPAEQPLPDGVQAKASSKWSWTYRRNYLSTFWMQDPKSIWKNIKGQSLREGHGPSDTSAILCAINFFGQEDKVYKMPSTVKGPLMGTAVAIQMKITRLLVPQSSQLGASTMALGSASLNLREATQDGAFILTMMSLWWKASRWSIEI